MVRKSGGTETIEAYVVQYSVDGNYAIYQSIEAGEKVLKCKKAGGKTEDITRGYATYVYDKKSEIIVTAGVDGIYYAENPFSEFVKLHDADNIYELQISEDRRSIAAFYMQITMIPIAG